MVHLQKLAIPNKTRVKQVADQISSALTQIPCVQAIALFGSLAENREDSWSDVDMLVACDNPEYAKWTLSSVIRDVKPVLYYRPFSTAQQPCGRYWFADESPFQKIDISFESIEDYDNSLNGSSRLGHDIETIEIYIRHGSGSYEFEHTTGIPLDINEIEQSIANNIYRSLRSLKHCFRGTYDTIGFDELLAAEKELSRDTIMAGGHIGKLVHSVCDYIRMV